MEFVGLPSPVVGRAGAGGHPCQGIYHRPARARPATAFIATHYNVDFSEHYLASYLAERGFGFLGWNTRFRGNEANFLLDHALAEIGVGVRWLREQAGADRVVLLGNSGGGSLMAAYQSQAVEPNVTPVTGMRPLAALADLPRGDLFIALAAHSGRPEVLTNWLDPSVTDERDPLSMDPALDGLRLVGGHQRPAARVAEQHDPVRPGLLAQPPDPDADLRQRVVEQEVRLVPAEPGIPAEEAESALGQIAGEIVLGEVDVVVGRDERRRRPGPGWPVVDALARVAAGARPADHW